MSRAGRAGAAGELALDPVAGFARVAADEEPQRPRRPALHRADQRRAEARDRLVVERIVARATADAVSAEQLRHGYR